MSELTLLRILLVASLAIAPLGTHRHFALGGREHRQGMPSRAPITAHIVALACAAIALFTPFALASLGWLLFTAGSFAVFLRARVSSLRSPSTLAACVPFLFSNIAAVWLVAGSNDLHLLGYGMHFSFYAALHGTVLGWILIGALAILADHESPQRSLYVVAIAVCFVSFLLIALGIDQLHALKIFGVIGLSIAIPIAQLAFLRDVWSRNRTAFALGCTSVCGLALTMFLAWRNELHLPVLVEIAGVRAMVSVHGVINTLIVAPSFLLAAVLDAHRPSLEARR
ncbi:MAG: YndJ family transporter [Deltaproteobacteria bacterium]|nr:YndJ family transporter [Deltaproteobacteria bacterium]